MKSVHSILCVVNRLLALEACQAPHGVLLQLKERCCRRIHCQRQKDPGSFILPGLSNRANGSSSGKERIA